ncbi:MAG: SCO family protein [Chloroherpetonaceae bacterium]|nr:SCO family protein [Chloroherpetonaceae bacterium]MDW8437529.1 SCO family protein [Chloroherpetonaceae bacterium]
MNKSIAIAIVAAIALMGAAFWLVRSADSPKPALLNRRIALPDFELFDQNGKRFSREDLKGKITIAQFIFTRCPSACPAMTRRAAELYALYKDAPEVQLISITVDPANDTQEVLRRYAQALGVTDERWKFLRCDSLQTIVNLCEKGFLLAAENLPSAHPTKFIVIDQNARVCAYYDYDDPKLIELITLAVRWLASEANRF